VQTVLDASPDGVRVVCSTRESEVVERLECDEIDLAQLAPEEASSMLRRQCPNVDMDDALANKFAKACGMHLLALSNVGNQLRRRCSKGCAPGDVLLSIERHRERLLDAKGKQTGWKTATITSCLACSYDALEDEEKTVAAGMSAFLPEKDIPLGALQLLGGYEDRSEAKMAASGLHEKSILLRFEDDVASLHGLIHEFLSGQ